MNKLYIDQITRSMNTARFKYKDNYEDQAMAIGSLEWLSGYLEGYLRRCLQTEDTGVCDLTWKHDDCALLMSMLYDITGEKKYMG